MLSAVRSPVRLAALFLLGMSFTYQFGANPPIDYPRLLIFDTQDVGHIFEDSEIMAFTAIAGGVWQSSQFYSAAGGQVSLPSPPTSYLRIAALALDALASNKARLQSVIELLDVKLGSIKDTAMQLRAQAQSYRDTDDNSGAFVIIEQVNNAWSFKQRFFNQAARQLGV
jgi:hypothetical protein